MVNEWPGYEAMLYPELKTAGEKKRVRRVSLGRGGLACPPLDMLYKNSVLHVNQL